METIFSKPGEGKTTRLIEEASKNGGTIACMNQREVVRIMYEADKMGLIIEKPITFFELIKGTKRVGVKILLIDNADYFLRQFFNGEITHITIGGGIEDTIFLENG